MRRASIRLATHSRISWSTQPTALRPIRTRRGNLPSDSSWYTMDLPIPTIRQTSGRRSIRTSFLISLAAIATPLVWFRSLRDKLSRTKHERKSCQCKEEVSNKKARKPRVCLVNKEDASQSVFVRNFQMIDDLLRGFESGHVCAIPSRRWCR